MALVIQHIKRSKLAIKINLNLFSTILQKPLVSEVWHSLTSGFKLISYGYQKALYSLHLRLFVFQLIA